MSIFFFSKFVNNARGFVNGEDALQFGVPVLARTQSGLGAKNCSPGIDLLISFTPSSHRPPSSGFSKDSFTFLREGRLLGKRRRSCRHLLGAQEFPVSPVT